MARQWQLICILLKRRADILYPTMKEKEINKPKNLPPGKSVYDDDDTSIKKLPKVKDELEPLVRSVEKEKSAEHKSRKERTVDEQEKFLEDFYPSMAKNKENEKTEANTKNAKEDKKGNFTGAAAEVKKTKLTDNNEENDIKQTLAAIKSFKDNYHAMKEANTKNADKYFHSRANCEAAQYGQTGANIAKYLSDLREDTDLIKNELKKKKDGTKMTKEEIIQDYIEDQEANIYGRNQGLKNPNINCKILVNKYRPNGLKKKY